MDRICGCEESHGNGGGILFNRRHRGKTRPSNRGEDRASGFPSLKVRRGEGDGFLRGTSATKGEQEIQNKILRGK